MSIYYDGRWYENADQMPQEVRHLAEACRRIRDDQLVLVVEQVGGDKVRLRVIGTRKAIADRQWMRKMRTDGTCLQMPPQLQHRLDGTDVWMPGVMRVDVVGKSGNN